MTKEPLLGVAGLRKGVCSRCGKTLEDPVKELQVEQMEPIVFRSDIFFSQMTAWYAGEGLK